MMVLLNQSSRIRSLLPQGSKLFASLIIFTTTIYAKVLPLYNPIKQSKSNTKLDIQAFVANDPVSLYDFFHDWDGKYTPDDGDNFALEFARVDIGFYTENDYYIGYFYQKDVLIRTNRGFVDGYYAVKNDIKPDNDTNYDLDMHIDGIIRHGLLLGKDYVIYDSANSSISLGIGGYISYDTDTQSGYLNGKGVLRTDSSYDAVAMADYYYMDNLLYDLDVEETYGIGYGMHVAVSYTNSQYKIDANFIANDLFARSHWNNLPYSLVYVATKNQIIGDDGYVEYNPTIYGWELYKDYTQKIEPKYHIDVSKGFEYGLDLLLGWEYTNHLSIPYMKLSKTFDEYKVALQYDYRFDTIGIEYIDDIVKLSIYSDGFKTASSVGLSLSVNYDF